MHLFDFADREFLRKFAAIALPVALMGLINFGVKAVDTLMLGLVGEVELSGASLANQFSFVMMVVGGTGVGTGCGVLTAQYWGAGNKERVREVFAFMFRLTAVINLLFASTAFLAPYHVLGILTNDEEVIRAGATYLRIMSAGYLVWGFTNTVVIILRSAGILRISVAAFSVSLFISASLNYVLIFGNFGFPVMGIAGAATATVIARAAEFVIIMTYVLKFDNRLAFRLQSLFRRGGNVSKSFIKYSLPVLINETFWATSFFILMMIMGRMGREFVAANAIGSLFIQFAGMVIFSVTGATSVIVGNTIGEGHYAKARRIANGMLGISFLIGLGCFVFVQTARLPFINFYELSDTARIYALQFTHIISVNLIFMSMHGKRTNPKTPTTKHLP